MLVVVSAQRLEFSQQGVIAALGRASVCIVGDLNVEGAGGEFVFNFPEAGEGFHHLIVDGAVGCQSGRLRHIADAYATLPCDGAAVGFEFTGEDAYEGCFARAVGTDDADAVALVNLEVNTGEDFDFAEEEG